jgi:hypothetical protein
MSDGDRTVGVVLVLPAPRDSQGHQNDLAVEGRALADVETLITAAQSLTADDETITLAFELDGQVVGWVESGQPDELLVGGLLEPWRESVAR